MSHDLAALQAEARAAVARWRDRTAPDYAYRQWITAEEQANGAAFRAYMLNQIYGSFRGLMDEVEHDLIEGEGTGSPVGFLSHREGQTEAFVDAEIRPSLPTIARPYEIRPADEIVVMPGWPDAPDGA